jgi:isopenicillin-N epimerase
MLRQLAEYVHADPQDIVFVLNASHGVNAVLRSVLLSPNEKILYLNLAYGMVKETLYFLREIFHEQLVEAEIMFPTTKEAIVRVVVEALEANPQIRLASFSHITSVPSLILPVEDLIRECRARNVMVLIDGAHALGQIPLNLTALNPDFYVANGHKWLYTVKGSAMLWVRKELQPRIFPTVISREGRGKTQFQLDFSWEGTMDFRYNIHFFKISNSMFEIHSFIHSFI